MPRSDRSPGEYSSHRGTPKKGPPSDRSSDYDSEDDDGPTLFGSILRTLMAGGVVVAIAVLVRVASALETSASRLRVFANIRGFAARTRARTPGTTAASPPDRAIGLPARLRETFPDDGPIVRRGLSRPARADRLPRLFRALVPQAKIERDQRNGVAPPSYTRRSYPSYTTRKPAVSSVGGGSKSAKTGSAAGGESRGGSYQVREGDTLYRIAVTHGVDPDTLQAMNPELAGRAHAIQVGEYVRVPRK